MKRTREGPTPTNISRNSEPETVMKGTPASPAVALAKRVFPKRRSWIEFSMSSFDGLPVPGGPVRIAP